MLKNVLPVKPLHEKPLSALLAQSFRRKIKRWSVAVFFGLLLTLLVVSLMGCVTPSQLPCEPLPYPTRPALSEPMPSVSYSISVGEHLRTWAQKLTGTQATSAP